MCCPQKFLAREAASCWMEAQWYELEKKTIFWGFLLPPHQRWWLRVSSCRERRRTWRGRGRPPIWCCSRPPSDGAGNSHLDKPVNCPFLGLSSVLRDKIFLDQGHRRPAVLLFQFWILTGSAGWRNDTGCQWWSSFGSFWWMVLEEIESLSKTTKLLLLDSLLQEVCIESGLLVSHNLLYSGLKKAHSKKKSFSKRTTYNLKCVVEIPCKKSCFLLVGSFYSDHMSYRKGFGCPLGPPAWSIGSDSVRLLSVSQSDKRQNYTKCLQQPVFPGGHPSKY